jgi:hypothetical protein
VAEQLEGQDEVPCEDEHDEVQSIEDFEGWAGSDTHSSGLSTLLDEDRDSGEGE